MSSSSTRTFISRAKHRNVHMGHVCWWDRGGKEVKKNLRYFSLILKGTTPTPERLMLPLFCCLKVQIFVIFN